MDRDDVGIGEKRNIQVDEGRSHSLQRLERLSLRESRCSAEDTKV